MSYLILQMLVFLLIAFLLGLILGWLLNRNKAKEPVKNTKIKEPVTTTSTAKKKIVEEVETKTEEKKIDIPTPVAPQPQKYEESEPVAVEVNTPPTIEKEKKTVSYQANVNVAEKPATEEPKVSPPASETLSTTTLNDIDLDSSVDLADENHGIESIEGIGPKTGNEFRAIGISNVADYLKNAHTVAQRDSLSEQLVIRKELLNNWASMSDLLRIPGLDHQSSELICVSGVRNVQEFARQEPKEFVERMDVINRSGGKSIAPKVPSVEEVSQWIQSASSMKAVVLF